MIKRITSAFLCLLMLCALLPASVFAAEVVTSVEISGIDAPVAGKNPDYTCPEDSIGLDNGYATYEDFDDEDTRFGKTWYDLEAVTPVPVKCTDTFIAGHRYGLAVVVKAKSGYEFKTETIDYDLYPRAKGTINGEKAKIGAVSGYKPSEIITLYYEFEAVAEKQVITDIILDDITAPVVGSYPEYISVYDSLGTDVGYTTYEQLDDMQKVIYGKSWIDIDDGYRVLGKTEPFKAGHRYAIDIYVCPKDGYKFENFSVINAYVNGKRATQVTPVEGHFISTLLKIRYEFSECTGEDIPMVDLWIDTPVAGNTPDYDVEIAVDNVECGDARNPVYSKNGVIWYDVYENAPMLVGGADAVFEAGKSYRFEAYLCAEDGYEFYDEVAVSLNGVVAEFDRLSDTEILVSCTYELEEQGSGGPVEYENPFTDVPEGQWYTEAILWCYHNGYMAGVSETQFGRKTNVSRAMFVTILAQIDKADTSAYSEMSFSDVPAGQWYSNSIEWAAQNGYAAGIGNGQFGRKADVSREQIALFFYTYSSLNGIDVSDAADLSAYEDAGRIHDWALDAVEWAVAKGLISGTSATTVAPRASATRAEIALIVKNYVENVLVTAPAPLTILGSPDDYYMQSSHETASFSVIVSGGVAPYLYEWYIYYDNEELALQGVESHQVANVLYYDFSDYDFDSHRDITVVCTVTDATGKKVNSGWAEVFSKENFAPLEIVSEPDDYYMSSSQEDASFTVEVAGGVGPYYYEWSVLYDNNEVLIPGVESNESSHTFVREFSDYDFDAVRGILVKCIITDATGYKVESTWAEVVQH